MPFSSARRSRPRRSPRLPHRTPVATGFGFVTDKWVVRLAANAADVRAAQSLRYEVFNLELGEGLASSTLHGRDEDRYDEQCDHLLVEERATGRVIGTYRLQTHEMACAGNGFYTANEFDLSYLPLHVLEDGVELGRACVSREHRGRTALMVLWRGIANYAGAQGKRYFFGASSLPSRDPRDGWRALDALRRRGALSADLWVPAQPGWACPSGVDDVTRPANRREVDGGLSDEGSALGPLPPLLDTYLRLGGRVCGPPVVDREFGTIDFLTVFDTEAMDAKARAFFFPDQALRRSA
jgi:putative hemolysin